MPTPGELWLIPAAGSTAVIDGVRYVAVDGAWVEQAAEPPTAPDEDLSFHTPPRPCSNTEQLPFGESEPQPIGVQFTPPLRPGDVPSAPGGCSYTNVPGFDSYQFGLNPDIAFSLAERLGADVVAAARTNPFAPSPLELTLQFGDCAFLNAGLVARNYLMYPPAAADIYTRDEIRQQCESDSTFTPIDAGNRLSRDRMAAIAPTRVQPALPSVMPEADRAAVLQGQGYAEAWRQVRAELADGTATERAIAATGEFRLSASGGIEVTGIAWQSLLQDATVPAAASAPKVQRTFVGVGGGGGTPTGEPVSTGVIIVFSVLKTLFGLGGGGVSQVVKTALEALRGAIVTIGDLFTRAIWQVARAASHILSALSSIWVRVLAPMLRRILELSQRLASVIDRVLRKYFETIERIRKTILDWYEKYARPVLLVIQRVRQVLAVLKFFRVPGAAKLDRYLAQIESRIIGVLQVALDRINILGKWVNVILTGKLLIQNPVFNRSLWAYQGDVVNLVWRSFVRPGGDGAAWPDQFPRSLEQSRADLKAYALYDGGPLAAGAARVVSDAEKYYRKAA